MNELNLQIKLGLDKSSVQSVKSALAELQSQANEASVGGADSTAPIKKNTDALKAQVSELRRKVNLAEADFRLGKMTQENLIRETKLAFETAQAQGLLGAQVDKNGTIYKSFSQAQLRAQDGFKGVGDASRRANFALINLGRIIQDLPFGFLGISNNIDPALDSLSRLNTETGGLGGTFKALLTSMKGPGGLIFLLGSILPSAVLISQRGFNMYAKKTKEAEKNTNELSDAILNLQFGSRDAFDFSLINQTANRSRELSEAFKEYSKTVKDKDRKDILEEESKRLLEQSNSLRARADGIVDVIASEQKLTDARVRDLFVEVQKAENSKKLLESQRDYNDLVAKGAEMQEAVLRFNEGDLQASERLRALENKRLESIDKSVALVNQQFGLDQQALVLQKELGLLTDQQFKTKQQQLVNEIILVKDRYSAEVEGIRQARAERQKEIDTIIKDISDLGDEVNLDFTSGLDSDADERRKRQEDIAKEGERARIKEIEAEQEKARKLDEIEQKSAQKRKEIRQQLVSASFGMASNLLSSLQQLNQSQTDQSEAQAKKRFEMEKKLSIAQALVNGAAAIVKTYQTYGFPTGIPFAIAQAAAAALQIKAIKDTQFNSGGSSRGGNASASASDKQGFFTTTEPKRPRTEAPIVINMSGDLDPEFLSVKVEKGNKARKRGTIFVASNQ